MMTAYRSSGEAIDLSADRGIDHVDGEVVWLDLVKPTPEEDAFAEKLTGIRVPTRDELHDIEPSSRLYSESGVVYLTASLLCKAETNRPILTDIGFVLTDRHLVTIRYDSPKAFTLFATALKRFPGQNGRPTLLLARLLETVTDRTAEVLELAERRADEMNLMIFGNGEPDERRQPRQLEQHLIDIARHHRLVSKARDSLVSVSRLVTYLLSLPSVKDDKESRDLCKSVTRDAQSLAEHANFISSTISFLLDASLGLINVEQNAIIKIFSIASVVFLPPTLVASIYGMNFQHMPELAWTWGYPASLALMIISAIVPYLIFRWKGWL